MLQAQLVERSPLRYTPAGLPALNFVLKHEGQASENGQMRSVVVDVKSKAIGHDITTSIQALASGTDAVFTGFLAAARNGRGVVFHVNTIDRLS